MRSYFLLLVILFHETNEMTTLPGSLRRIRIWGGFSHRGLKRVRFQGEGSAWGGAGPASRVPSCFPT